MKAGKSSETVDGLAELGDEFLGGFVGRVVGGDAADQLDELHHRHRVHEVDADEAFSGRSVAAASRVIEIEDVLVAIIASGRRDGQRLREDLALHLLVLGRRLDDEVAGRRGRRRSGPA